MTVLADLIRARFVSKPLPAELVEAGKLPGTTIPASVGTRKRPPRQGRAAPEFPPFDLSADLAWMPSIASAGFLPMLGYSDAGAIASVAPPTEEVSNSGVPRCDLLPHYAMFGSARSHSQPVMSAMPGASGHRIY